MAIDVLRLTAVMKEVLLRELGEEIDPIIQYGSHLKGAAHAAFPPRTRGAAQRLRLHMSVEVFANRGELSLTHCVQANDTRPALSLRAAGGPVCLPRWRCAN